MKKLSLFSLLLLAVLAGCANFNPSHRTPASGEAPDVYQIFGENYLADFSFGQFLGKDEAQNKSCVASVKEGQDILAVYQKSKAYQGMTIPDGLVIDGLLKRKALVFVLNMSVGEEGLGGLMSAFEGVDKNGQPVAADFLHTNNRIIFGILPVPEDVNAESLDKSKALRATAVVVKGPSLCGITGSYDSLPKVNVVSDERGMQMEITCGGDAFAQSVYWKGSFTRDAKLKYKFQLDGFEYQSFAGVPVMKDGKKFRSVNKKEKLIDLKCRGMKHLDIAT